MKPRGRSAFTLVEILVVVIILGILSAIVVPQFAGASEEAKIESTKVQLQKLRNTLAVYYVRNNAKFPNIDEGDGTWAEVLAEGYMHVPPNNQYVGANGRIIQYGVGPDAAFQDAYGWIYNPATGDVWAGSYDANDKPLPRP
ncbi:MAG: prepilin-type N-terminal cleavage/methylation domain-containing protein [Phycisphaerales bacterium]|nr:prepilin-type N-terminal cleavage/methylation domain-containing protein [Phycisphaerales bacterium]